MDTTKVRITISGKTLSYKGWSTGRYQRSDDSAIEYKIEAAFKTAVSRNVGKGYQFVLELDADAAEEIARDLHDNGEDYVQYGIEPDVKADGRAMLADAAKIRKAIAAAVAEAQAV